MGIVIIIIQGDVVRAKFGPTRWFKPEPQLKVLEKFRSNYKTRDATILARGQFISVLTQIIA
jgi:hypothetical protein